MATGAARLDRRLNPTDKARIARAAGLRGVPLSAFVRDADDPQLASSTRPRLGFAAALLFEYLDAT